LRFTIDWTPANSTLSMGLHPVCHIQLPFTHLHPPTPYRAHILPTAKALTVMSLGDFGPLHSALMGPVPVERWWGLPKKLLLSLSELLFCPDKPQWRPSQYIIAFIFIHQSLQFICSHGWANTINCTLLL
jgi:hypothetical protein